MMRAIFATICGFVEIIKERFPEGITNRNVPLTGQRASPEIRWDENSHANQVSEAIRPQLFEN